MPPPNPLREFESSTASMPTPSRPLAFCHRRSFLHSPRYRPFPAPPASLLPWIQTPAGVARKRKQPSRETELFVVIVQTDKAARCIKMKCCAFNDSQSCALSVCWSTTTSMSRIVPGVWCWSILASVWQGGPDEIGSFAVVHQLLPVRC